MKPREDRVDYFSTRMIVEAGLSSGSKPAINHGASGEQKIKVNDFQILTSQLIVCHMLGSLISHNLALIYSAVFTPI